MEMYSERYDSCHTLKTGGGKRKDVGRGPAMTGPEADLEFSI